MWHARQVRARYGGPLFALCVVMCPGTQHVCCLCDAFGCIGPLELCRSDGFKVAATLRGPPGACLNASIALAHLCGAQVVLRRGDFFSSAAVHGAGPGGVGPELSVKASASVASWLQVCNAHLGAQPCRRRHLLLQRRPGLPGCLRPGSTNMSGARP